MQNMMHLPWLLVFVSTLLLLDRPLFDIITTVRALAFTALNGERAFS